MGTFTPLIVGTNGGMGTESQFFLKNLSNFFYKESSEQTLPQRTLPQQD